MRPKNNIPKRGTKAFLRYMETFDTSCLPDDELKEFNEIYEEEKMLSGRQSGIKSSVLRSCNIRSFFSF